jgi:hypothetical protein
MLFALEKLDNGGPLRNSLAPLTAKKKGDEPVARRPIPTV